MKELFKTKIKSPWYIAIAILKLESTAIPRIEYYGDSEMLSNTISSIPLNKEKKSEYIIDTVVDDTKLWYIDLDNTQCGKINVNNIAINDNEVLGIYVKAKEIIQPLEDIKEGKVNEADPKYYDYVRPFILNIHIKETN